MARGRTVSVDGGGQEDADTETDTKYVLKGVTWQTTRVG